MKKSIIPERCNWNSTFLSQSSIFQVIHGAHIEPAHIIRKRSLDQPLRMTITYDESVYRLDEDKFELVNVSVMLISYNPHKSPTMHFFSEDLLIADFFLYCLHSYLQCLNLDFPSTDNYSARSCSFLGESTHGEGNETSH